MCVCGGDILTQKESLAPERVNKVTVFANFMANEERKIPSTVALFCSSHFSLLI